MKHEYRPRRPYTTVEIATIRELAAQGETHREIARLLNRTPGSLSKTASARGIKFIGIPGPAITVPGRQRERENCRAWRRRQGMASRIRELPPVMRFDDPRVMM